MSLTVTSAYAGGFAGMAATLFNDVEALRAGMFQVAEGKFKSTFGKITSANLSQLYRSTPIDRGTLTVTEKVLPHNYFMYYAEFNPIEQFRQFWVPEVISEADFASLNPEIQRLLLDEFLRGAAENFNDTMFQGPATPTEALSFTGLKANMLADGDVLDCASPTTISNSNAVTELDEIRQKCTAKMKKAQGFAYIVDYDWYEFLIDDVSGDAASDHPLITITYDADGQPMIRYRGAMVHGLTGLPADTGMAGVFRSDTRGNFAVAWENPLDRQPMIGKVQANSHDWFFRMDMGVDVDVIDGANSVLYGT